MTRAAARKEPKPRRHSWAFARRFRRRAFGWRSRPAIERIREAVAEIRGVARTDPSLAAEGAVVFLERLSPALEQVDSSSGAIGAAVNRAIEQLVPLVAKAPAAADTRTRWLERLLRALEEDDIPYIESLGDHWGELCGSAELASAQADALVGTTRLALSPDPKVRGHFFGISACLSALYRAGRHEELYELVRSERYWGHRAWGAKALIAQGRRAEALRFVEATEEGWGGGREAARLCEEILLSSGLAEEAFSRYALAANRAGTFLATFRAVARRYPDKPPREILEGLAAATPGEEGKWFAAARRAGLLDEALALVKRSPCDPRTLARAARDHAASEPRFAAGCGLAALRWVAQGYDYETEAADVALAFDAAMQAAASEGRVAETTEQLREILAEGGPGRRFVTAVLGRHLAQD